MQQRFNPDEIKATKISLGRLGRLGRQSSLPPAHRAHDLRPGGRALRKTNIYHAGYARNYKNIVFFTLCVPCDLSG
jgi:hypothetical protein